MSIAAVIETELRNVHQQQLQQQHLQQQQQVLQQFQHQQLEYQQQQLRQQQQLQLQQQSAVATVPVVQSEAGNSNSTAVAVTTEVSAVDQTFATMSLNAATANPTVPTVIQPVNAHHGGWSPTATQPPTMETTMSTNVPGVTASPMSVITSSAAVVNSSGSSILERALSEIFPTTPADEELIGGGGRIGEEAMIVEAAEKGESQWVEGERES